MKKFIKDYIKILAFTFTGVVFILASFYLIMNYNHNEEIKKTIYIGENDIYYQNHKDILSKISSNLLKFRNTNNKNSAYSMMYQSLSNCYNVLQDEGTFSKVTPNNIYTSIEIHKLGSTFQDKIMNSCYVLNLSYLKTNDVPKEFKNIAPFVTSYIESINNNISDSLAEIENNSSYFYSTNITSATVRNYLGSSYKTVASSYNDFAQVLLYLSDYINNGGSND